MQFSYSLSKNGEISTGNILVCGNLFDGICSGKSDCGCVKFWSVSESHAWKNVLMTENLCVRIHSDGQKLVRITRNGVIEVLGISEIMFQELFSIGILHTTWMTWDLLCLKNGKIRSRQ